MKHNIRKKILKSTYANTVNTYQYTIKSMKLGKDKLRKKIRKKKYVEVRTTDLFLEAFTKLVIFDEYKRREDKAENYGVTCVDGHGTSGQVKVVFTIVPRREVRSVVELIKKFNPNAFYSIGEVGLVESGIFPVRRSWRDFSLLGLFRPFRKGK